MSDFEPSPSRRGEPGLDVVRGKFQNSADLFPRHAEFFHQPPTFMSRRFLKTVEIGVRVPLNTMRCCACRGCSPRQNQELLSYSYSISSSASYHVSAAASRGLGLAARPASGRLRLRRPRSKRRKLTVCPGCSHAFWPHSG